MGGSAVSLRRGQRRPAGKQRDFVHPCQRPEPGYGYLLDAPVQRYAWADYAAGLTPVNGVYPDAANKLLGQLVVADCPGL